MSEEAKGPGEASGAAFPWREIVVLAFCSLLAGPFCSAGARLMLDGETLRGLTGFAVGVPIGIIGVTFHWWKDRVSGGWLIRTADRGWPLALGFAFLYVTGFFQSSAPRPSPPAGASANDIAEAVIQKMPKTVVQPSSPVPLAAKTPYVNPIHNDAAKWGVSSGIRAAIIRSGLSPDCHVIITRLPVTYSEDLAADLKSVLDVIGWKYEEHLATTTVEKEISIRALDSSSRQTHDCANALSSRLQNDGRTRTGGSYNVGTRWLVESEAPEYLKLCATPCFEVTIGNEDPSR